jgi:biotin carboxylase
VENVRAIDIVSPYTASFLESKGMNLPPFLLAPPDGSEMNWATDRGIDVENENICVIAESDAGVPTAERIASSLNLRGNGISPQLRNKFLSNERVKSFGMKAVKQVLAHDWKEAGSFLEDELWFDIDSANRFCVVKPYRGVASDGVFLCRGFEEARKAFKALHKKPQFGGGINEAVLVQEYVSGQEYAVDTVAMDGDIKVVALWRYKKLPANGAPFVYQCTELCSMITDEGRLVCEYCIGALKAQGLKWGPTHTEVSDAQLLAIIVTGLWVIIYIHHKATVTDR